MGKIQLTSTSRGDFCYVEGDIYDPNISKVILAYDEMHKAIVRSIPFKRSARIMVLDLGIGTGKTAEALLKIYPNAQLVGIDLFRSMLNKAKERLLGYERVELKKGNFVELDFGRGFDLVVSALAIHHLSNEDKKKVFSKAFHCLKNGGCFVNGDITTFSNSYLRKTAQEISDRFVRENVESPRVRREWLNHHHNINNPSTVEEQLSWLREAGFRWVACVLRYYTTAVFVGYKR